MTRDLDIENGQAELAVTAAPDTPGKVTAEIAVPADATAGTYPITVGLSRTSDGS